MEVIVECEIMIIWIIAAYIQFGICLLRIGNDGAGAGCVVCLRFAAKTTQQNHGRCVFIVDFQLIHTSCFGVPIVDFG